MQVYTKLISRCTKELFNLPVFITSKNSRISRKFSMQQNMSFSRFSASTIQTGCDIFNFNDYDCIGFDLDNTVCTYNIREMVLLEYNLLSKFLVEQRGYNPDYLLQPLKDKIDFLQKGLILDFAKGNILRVAPDGYIEKATHGTKLLSNREITEYYGAMREWAVTTQYVQDLLVAWNGPLEKEVRSCLDYFDMPGALCFAHCVDSIDAGGSPNNCYNIWPDILDGLTEMFNRDNFARDKGGFFPALKNNPDKYINKCSDSVLSWLEKLNREKTTFLITGSNVDFASFVAKNGLGENWTNLFDVIVFYARKPGFFTGNRPFLKLEGNNETSEINIVHDSGPHIYSQGNWKELIDLLAYLSGENKPKVVYVGDNLVQDIYTPSKYDHCDTVALVEEMYEDGIKGVAETHPNAAVLSSKMWGSYFNVNYCGQFVPSLWSDIIHRHSKICIPSLNTVACHPLDHKFTTFSANEFSTSGFHPGEPRNIAK